MSDRAGVSALGRRPPRGWGPISLGLGVALVLCLVRWIPDAPSSVPFFLGTMAGAFGCYYAGLLALRRCAVSAKVIVAVAILVQAAPFRSAPLYDRDIYRYHWDGMLLSRGVNPFAYAPGDHHLARMRDAYWKRIEYKWVKTVYPPVTQLLMALTYGLDPTPRRVMLAAMAFNMLTLWPLLLLLRAHGTDDRWLAIYAWNPLLANAFASAGHLDPVSMCFLLAALSAALRGSRLSAAAMLALSVMSKTQILLAAPLVLRRTGPAGWAVFAVVCAALLLPFSGAGAGSLLAGSMAYASRWEFNSGVFALLRMALGSAAARIVTGAALLGLTAWLTWRSHKLVRDVGIALAALLAVSPTFFPWYYSWVLPFVCLYPTMTGVAVPFLLLATYLHTYSPAVGSAARPIELGLAYSIGALELGILRRRRGGR